METIDNNEQDIQRQRLLNPFQIVALGILVYLNLSAIRFIAKTCTSHIVFSFPTDPFLSFALINFSGIAAFVFSGLLFKNYLNKVFIKNDLKSAFTFLIAFFLVFQVIQYGHTLFLARINQSDFLVRRWEYHSFISDRLALNISDIILPNIGLIIVLIIFYRSRDIFSN